MKDAIEEVIKEYTPEYCHSLEMIYGAGMMSEGGASAIEDLFEGIPIKGKKALDIGSGLGGVAIYLASKYSAYVTGLEINPWMIELSKKRASGPIKAHLEFIQSTTNDHFPLESESFDVVYSKGALCHVEHKAKLFQEAYRVLKPGGSLVINDWLSPKKGKWGPYVEKLIELEGLSLFAETVEGYRDLLRNAKFQDIKVFNDSEKYAKYNEEIVETLLKHEKKKEFIQAFNETLYEEAIEGYGSIAKAMRNQEGIVSKFVATK